jgi:hypothetical protein
MESYNRAAALAQTLAASMMLALAAGTATAHGGHEKHGGHDKDRNDTEILVLSNRADLISGGNALVEIVLPGKHGKGKKPSVSRVELNGENVTSAFAVRADGRIYGLVTGLRDGRNTLKAHVYGGSDARITLTNHPIGGPVISGEQVQPWTCQTETSNSNTNLGPALDAQCNAPTLYRFIYRTTSNSFAAYEPASPPAPELVASTTTDQGVTVPYIVRIERGTMNRGLNEIAVLYDPAMPWTPWSRQPQWNGKVLMVFGAGTSQQYRQGTTQSVQNNEALSLGFAVATSSMLVNGQHSNFVTAAETTMMLKEHIAETYGPIRYTIGQGSSGGALLQYLIADNYPGLLDGLRPTQDWQDSVSAAYREFADSAVLVQAFNSSPLTYSTEERAAIGGWGAANVNVFNIENNRIGDYNRPDDGTSCAGADSYHPTQNPLGVRCTFQDFMTSVVGRRGQDGHANLMFDNVGVQYGLGALVSGALSPEKFVDANARAGGFDVDGRWQPQRSEIDRHVAALLHRTGQVTYGRQMGAVPIVAIRGTNNNDYHFPFRTVVNRHRLVAANGHADNHVYWIAPPSSQSTLVAIDRWLVAIETDGARGSKASKVVRNKPADVVSACWIGGAMVTDLALCDTTYPYFREPRTVAGEAPTIYTMKCRLKPLSRLDYGVAFTDEQWATLNAAFPDGVCDFSRPPVGFQVPEPWLTYAHGPGGRALGRTPSSSSDEGHGHARHHDEHHGKH